MSKKRNKESRKAVRPTNKEFEIADQFSVNMHAERVLSIGRQGFAEKGRGAVIIFQTGKLAHTNVALPEDTSPVEALITYEPLNNPAGWPDAITRRMVETYDVDRQIVVVVTGTNRPTSAYKIRRNTQPAA